MDKFNEFENKHRAFINLIIKPLLTLIAFLSMGYYTMWLSTNYVRQDKFSAYIEKQIQFDKQQDELSKSRFDITQTKLEAIITQQTIFNEQLKTFNNLSASYQKQLDSLNDRIIYLERQK
jgi:septal ring factor EnvC (AmiA/AmiB activator)